MELVDPAILAKASALIAQGEYPRINGKLAL